MLKVWFSGEAIRVEHVVPLELRAALGASLLAETEQVIAAVQAVEMIERYEIVPHKIEVALRATRLAAPVEVAPTARAFDVEWDEVPVGTALQGTSPSGKGMLPPCKGSLQPVREGIAVRLHDRCILRGFALMVKPARSCQWESGQLGTCQLGSFQFSVRTRESVRTSD